MKTNAEKEDFIGDVGGYALSPAARMARVFAPFAMGYLLSYAFRTVNAVIAPSLVDDVELSATNLGFLTSAFFLAYCCAQLPIGILLDRFGPHRVEAVLLLIAGTGSLVFALGDSAATLAIGRALIGLGVSACGTAAFTAFAKWFEQDRLSFVNGGMMACGGLGALAATAPVEWALSIAGWRMLFIAAAVPTVLLALMIFIVAPNNVKQPERINISSQIDGLKFVFHDRLFWRVTPLAAITIGSFLAFQGLWAGTWLRDVAELDAQAAALHLAVLSCGLIAGFFVMGSMAMPLIRSGISTIVIIGVGSVAYLVVVVALAAGIYRMTFLVWGAFGFFGTSSALSYALLSTAFPDHLIGRVNTTLNLVVFVAAFVIQWGIGSILHLWENPVSHTYAPQGYQVVFTIVASLIASALIWFLFPLRQTCIDQ